MTSDCTCTIDSQLTERKLDHTMLTHGVAAREQIFYLQSCYLFDGPDRLACGTTILLLVILSSQAETF